MQQCAFLRAINVGGRVVKMERLRQILTVAKFRAVKTFIASGNVIFDDDGTGAAQVEQRIENCLSASLGYEVDTFVRTTPEVREIADVNPFTAEAEDGSSLYIGFLKKAPDRRVRESVQSLSSTTDLFHIHKRELYWVCRTRISDSPVSGALLEKKLGMPMTMRNRNTLRRIAAAHPVS